MKPSPLSGPALAITFLAVIPSVASAAVAVLTSPDGAWRLQSDEFGAYGAGIAGGGAFHDFGSGTIDYSWASSLMLTDGATRQPLSSDLNAGWTGAPLNAGNVISDSVVANTRTSSYSVPGFAGLTVTLSQTAANLGITQTYVLSNSGSTPLSLSALSFHDVDLDGSTWTNNLITSSGGALSVSEGSRFVRFSPATTGYLGFLAGHVPGGGVTGGLDTFVFNNFGIPGGVLNQFADFTGGGLGANFDTDSNGISDSVADVGFVFQNNVVVPAGGSVSLTYTSVPEPSGTLLSAAALGFFVRRRR